VVRQKSHINEVEANIDPRRKTVASKDSRIERHSQARFGSRKHENRRVYIILWVLYSGDIESVELFYRGYYILGVLNGVVSIML